jgi:ssDNA-specific exonuclease RecJ
MRYPPNKNTDNPPRISHRFEHGLIYAFFYQKQLDAKRVLTDEYAFTPEQFRDLAFEMLKIYEELGFVKEKDGSTGFF